MRFSIRRPVPEAAPSATQSKSSNDRIGTTLGFYMFVEKAGKAAEETNNQYMRQQADFLLVASLRKHLQNIKNCPFPIKSLLLYH
jgi:hypothetical protein